jgi:signal transduction histidine kinase
MDTYTFSANENDRVFITMAVTSGTLDPRILLYRPDGTLFEPDDLPLQKAAREGADAANVEIIQRTPSGEDRVAIWNAAPLRGPDGRVIGAVAIGHDISEQRQAEAAQERLMAEIRSSHRTLETLIETMQVGVIFCNSAGEITLTNPAAAAMFRGPLTGDAYGPQGSYTLNLPDGRPYPPEELPLPRALRGEVTGQVEILVRRSDGEEVWLWVAGRPIREGSGKIIGAVASMIDISELKQSEAALQEAHDQLELRVKERTQELSLREASLRDTARALEEANAQLQRLSRRLVQVQEDERRDIARELHDEAGQLLTAMKVGLTLLERDIPAMSDAIAARIGELKAAAEEAQESLHGLAVNLRPAVLDRVGVAAAVRQYLETFERRTGMQVDFVEMGMNQQRLSKEIELALYRVVQETLTNVMRHAQATAVGVIIERRDDVIIAIVEDNGVGFDPEADAAGGRLGLFGMQERVETVGGHMTVESAPGRGTTVYVQIPLQEGARLSDTAVPYSRSA